MRCVICGAGQMGLPTIWAMRQLGFKVSVIDTSEAALNKVVDYYPPHPMSSASIDRFVVSTHIGTCANYTDLIKEADVVISTLPYMANYNLAIKCVNYKVPYCDLGGHVRTSSCIKDYSEKCSGCVFTDLGLAPGWINIMAEAGYQAVKEHLVDNVEMYVGGLPCNPNVNPMGYVPTWSVDGLMNEYGDECIIMEHGSIKKVPGMSDVHPYQMNGYHPIINMECFNTSGGAAHTIETMCERRVKRCVYNTIRYAGHRDFYRWLQSVLVKKDLKAFLHQVQESEGRCADIVFMEVCIGCNDGASWHNSFIYDTEEESGQFSAMQVCTTMPLAIVASMIARKKLPDKRVLSYEDVPYEEFDDTIHKLIEEQKEWYVGK